MENKITKLKGIAYSREEYLYKKAHPTRWKIKQWFKKLSRHEKKV